MASVDEIQTKSGAVLQAAATLVGGGKNEEAFKESIENLYNCVRTIKTGSEVGATADKLFRQSNLLHHSSEELVNAVKNGGSIEPFYTRVKNGTINVQKTAQQLFEESA